MTDALVLGKIDDQGIYTITLNRPEQRNALSIALLQQLCEKIEEAQNNPKSRVVILRGEGPVFCAGLDLKEAMQSKDPHQSAEYIGKALHLFSSCPLPTIASVHGASIAGGAGLMSSCDLVIASDDLKLGFTEVRIGMVPALIMPFLCRQMSDRNLREALLLGEMFDAKKGNEFGLINRVVAREDLEKETLKLAQLAIKRGSRGYGRDKKSH